MALQWKLAEAKLLNGADEDSVYVAQSGQSEVTVAYNCMEGIKVVVFNGCTLTNDLAGAKDVIAEAEDDSDDFDLFVAVAVHGVTTALSVDDFDTAFENGEESDTIEASSEIYEAGELPTEYEDLLGLWNIM